MTTPSLPAVPPRSPRVPWQVKYAALALIWGSSFLLMKVGLHALAPIQIAALRIVFGALILLIVLRLTGGRLPTDRRVWAHLIVTGIFLSTLPFFLFAWGETRVSSALAGIGNATTPLAAVLVGAVLLPAQRPTRAKLVAVVAGFLGVVLIMQPWTVERPDPIGFTATLLGGACYGVGWTYNRRFLGAADLGGLSQPAATLSMGALMMLPVWLGWWLVHRTDYPAPWSLVHDGTDTPGWLALAAVLALGIVGTGIAYIFQFDVIRSAGVTVGASITYLIPVVSVVLGALVLKEHLTAYTLIGFAIVLAAAVVINRPTKPAAAP